MKKVMMGVVSMLLVLQFPIQLYGEELIGDSSNEISTEMQSVDNSKIDIIENSNENIVEETEIQDLYESDLDEEEIFFDRENLNTEGNFNLDFNKTREEKARENVEVGQRKPREIKFPEEPIKIKSMLNLREALENSDITYMKLENNIDLTRIVTIPSNGKKLIDLNNFTINAGNTGQIKVNGDYLKIMNGDLKGGYGENQGDIPPEEGQLFGNSTAKYGFIYGQRNNENDIVIENVTHENSGNRGGFITVHVSNIFFSKDVTLKNGNYNIKGGSITFLENSNFKGSVNRNTTSSLGWDAHGSDGTVNIGFWGYGTNAFRKENHRTNGDKRITVLKNADVELVNGNRSGKNTSILNRANYERYTNCIANFNVLTVYGTLKMESEGAPLRSISSEKVNNTHLDTPYKRSVTRTHNAHVNINVMDGATLTAKVVNGIGDQGVLFTYNTVVNVFSAKEFDLYNTNSKATRPAFHAGKPDTVNAMSSLNVYNSFLGFWAFDNVNNLTPAPSGDVEIYVNQDFYTFNLNTDLKETWDAYIIEPYDLHLKAARMHRYGRIRTEGKKLIINPKEVYKNTKGDGYEFGNGGPEFSGTVHYEHAGSSSSENINGIVYLVNDKTGNAYTTPVKSDGSWKFDVDQSHNVKEVGNYTLYVKDDKNISSEKLEVKIKDNVKPTGTAKLYKFKKGTTTALTNPKLEALSAYNDETSTGDDLKVTYFKLSQARREEIIRTVGKHIVQVEIKDAASNFILLDVEVLVYEGSEPTRAYIEGSDFNIAYQSFVKATVEEQRQIIIQLGKVKGYEIVNDKVNDITNDTQKFYINYPEIPQYGGRVNVKLEIKNGSQVLATKTIIMNLQGGMQEVKIHHVEYFYNEDSWVGQGLTDDLLKQTKFIFSDLKNEEKIKPIVTYVTRNTTGDKTLNTEETLKILEQEGVINLDKKGYLRLKNEDKRYVVRQEKFNGSVDINYLGKFSSDQSLVKETIIYIQYYPKTLLASVPKLSYGDLAVTKLAEETHALEKPSISDPQVNVANKIFVVNTALQERWNLNVALKETGIKNEYEDEFMGGLVYYENGKAKMITDEPQVIYQHNKPSNQIDIITEINLYSEEETEGLRLKQVMGNRVGNYTGTLLWSLTDGPKL